MAELFIELFSEEIPARLQRRGAEELARLVGEALAGLAPAAVRTFFGPRRIALAAEVNASIPASSTEERGPRVGAPEQALAGFLRKYSASREDLRAKGDFWTLEKVRPEVDAGALVAAAMPDILWRFGWPKSMRWGGTSGFTWIRPLRRITCLLDGAVVPFSLARGDDDGHGLISGNLTEGHRQHGPCVFAVSGVEDWIAKLLTHYVMPKGRMTGVRDSLSRVAAKQGLSIVDDPELVEEVAGLVEWIVPLMGRIDDGFMDLPPEVMQVSMRVNQRYFATRGPDGAAAPWFAFVANAEAPDGGAAIVAGNERVLRARFSDARHFFDLDRRTRLEDRVPALDGIVFQAELGTQGDRVKRLVRLAGVIAPLVGADAGLAARAALLCKADLSTGMVGEFPELQGVMGGYYAAHDGEDTQVAAAIREHYGPKGAGDSVPSEPTSIAVALADKLDQLAAFFAIGQRPSGSGDPYALRRAALGVIRIIRENDLRLNLAKAVDPAIQPFKSHTLRSFSSAQDLPDGAEIFLRQAIVSFIIQRLQIQLKTERIRGDAVVAAFASSRSWDKHYDIVGLIKLASAVQDFIATPDGETLLGGYKRATNILKIEDSRDGPHGGEPTLSLEPSPTGRDLIGQIARVELILSNLPDENFKDAMQTLAQLRKPLDAFFEDVTVNDPDEFVRVNRLKILWLVRKTMRRVADFSAIQSTN